MKILSAVAFYMLLATAAVAQGTDTGPGGTNTGKDPAAMNPTTEQCAQGWDPSLRMSQAEFDAACEKQ